MSNKLASILVIFLLAIIFHTSSTSAKDYSSSFGAITNNNESQLELKEFNDAVFIGDIFLGRAVERLIRNNGNAYPFKNLTPFASTTAVVANFESSINPKHVRTPDLTYAFSTRPEYFKLLADYGINYLNLANNHSQDFQEEGYQLVLDSASKYGMETLGHMTKLNASSTKLFRLNNEKVRLYSLNFIFNQYDEANLLENIRNFPQDEFLVIVVHWGNEYELVNSAEQERLARELVAAGADLIIGHHPHVIQNISMIDGVPVIYSLGNYIFDQYFSEDVQQGLQIRIEKTLTDWQLIIEPVSSLAELSAPKIMVGAEKQKFLEKLADRSDASISENIKAGIIIF